MTEGSLRRLRTERIDLCLLSAERVQQGTALMEICVLRDDREPVMCGIRPDRVVVGLEAFVPDVGRAAVEIGEEGQ